MKIAVNTRLLIKDKLDGIGWFTCETLRRITVQHPEHRFFFLFDRKFSNEFVFSDNVQAFNIGLPARHPALYYLWFEYSVPRILRKIKPDLFLSPDGIVPVETRHAVSLPRFLPVIHDLNFETFPNDLPFSYSKYYRHFFPKFAHKATRIATVSEFSKQDIVKRYSIPAEKIDVVYDGANEIYKPVSQEIQSETRNKYAAGNPYFLFTGSLHPRKNIANILRAFDGFKKNDISRNVHGDIKLLLVGNKMWWTREMENVFRKMMYQSDVVFAGRLGPEALSKVTASAYCMLYPSTFEGFGIPILEAMCCDVPVITSNVTSMPEVGGDAALLVDPFSPESITLAMLKIFSDHNLRLELIEKGRKQREKFSWQQTADKLWDCIEKTMDK